MAKFCRECGQPVNPGAKFCRNCGTKIIQSAPQKPVTEAAPPIIPEEGLLLPAEDAPKQPAPDRAVQGGEQLLGRVAVSAVTSAAGELDLGAFSAGTVREAAEAAAAPVAGIFKGIGSYISGIFGIFRSPLTLIGTLLIAAAWYFLKIGEFPDKDTAGIVSFLTYAEGGFDREGIAGMAAGMIGKGTVAAALVSVLNGGILSAFRGIGSLFVTKGGKRSFLATLLGLVIGAAVYIGFVGPDNAGTDTAMAGISLSVLMLEAMGSRDGRLFTLAKSLTSRVTDGVRQASAGRADSLLTGIAVGSAAAAVFFAVR